MGIEYDLVSDSAREGYRLGKGPWGNDDFKTALKSEHPIEVVHDFLVEEGFEPADAERIAREVVGFAAQHADWRVIDDYSSDIWVASDEDRAEHTAEFGDDDDPPLYKKIGSRYLKGEVAEEDDEDEGAAVAPTVAQAEIAAQLGGQSMRFLLNRLPMRSAPRIGLTIAYEADIAPGETVELAPASALRSDNRLQDLAAMGSFRPRGLTTKWGETAVLQRVFIRDANGREEDQLAAGASVVLAFFTRNTGMTAVDMSTVVPPAKLLLLVQNPTEERVLVRVEIAGVMLEQEPVR